jgi:hypothetical protein
MLAWLSKSKIENILPEEDVPSLAVTASDSKISPPATEEDCPV